MVWSQGGLSNVVTSGRFNDLSARGILPSKVTQGSLIPLPTKNNYGPPDQSQQSSARLANGLQGLSTVDRLNGDVGFYDNGYLQKAEDLMFRANNINSQAQQLRLQNLTPIFRQQQNYPVRLSNTFTGNRGGGGGGGVVVGKNAPKGSFARFVRAISGQESGGNYHVRNRSSGASGRYQIMPANFVGPGGWDKQTIGRDISLQQFMNNPRLQDQIAQGMMRKYFNAYGAAGAASTWYSGSPTKYKTGAGGGAGYPSVAAYVRQVMQRMRG